MIKTVGIPIAFVMLTTLLLWFLIQTKGLLVVKMIVIVCALFFCFLLWNSIEGMMGYPTDNALPPKFEVLSVAVREPTKDFAGAIFVWVKPGELENDDMVLVQLPINEPKSFRLPYSKEMHKEMQEIQELIMNGKRVLGKNKKEREGENGDGGDFSQEQEPMFYELPPPKLPEKVINEIN